MPQKRGCDTRTVGGGPHKDTWGPTMKHVLQLQVTGQSTKELGGLAQENGAHMCKPAGLGPWNTDSSNCFSICS